MLRKGLLLLLVLAALAPARASAQAGASAWARYTYPGEEFSVELPGQPWVHHTSRTVLNRPPYDSDKARVFGLYSGGVVYMVVSFDRPRSIETFDQFAGFGWDGRGMARKGEVRLGELAGAEYEVGHNFKGAARVFRTRRHAYLLKAFSDVEGHGREVARFLDSFELAARPQGEFITDDPPSPPFKPPKEKSEQITGGVGPGRGGGPAAAAPAVSEEALKLARGAGAAPGAAGPFSQREVARKAVIVYKPEPGYTESARMKNVTGVVRLRAVLASTGKVTNVSVLKWLPEGLTDKAITAAHRMLFFPAVKDGREVSQYVIIEYNFNIY